MVCTCCSAPSEDRLCSGCQFWDHCFTQPDPTGDEDSCIFCNQMRNKTEKKELVYDQGTETVPAEDGGQLDEGETVSSDSYPSGPEESWTFFYNLIHPDNGLNIKLGDCIELSEPNEKTEGKVIRCQFLLRDKLKVPWISGYELIKVCDIPSLMKKGKKRKRKPVGDEFPVSGGRVILDASECFTKLTKVKKIVCGLPLTDYEFGKPKGIDDLNDVFSCGFRFDPISCSSMHFVIPDYKTCFDPLVWERFVEPPEELSSVVIVSCQNDSMSPSILRKDGTPRRSSERRISFSANLVQKFEYADEEDAE